MKLPIFALGICAAIAAFLCSAPTAQAGGYPGYGWGTYSVYVQDQIPYFSQHPPVYYSRPVARPYGYSPYPYPPSVMTPEPPPEAAMILNPFVPRPVSKPAATPEDAKTAQAPLRITNPFVVGELTVPVSID